VSHTPAFQLQQRQFLNYLRQPQTIHAPAGFAPERLAIYADLLYNKFDESLTACFPVLRSILSQEDWRALLLDFIAEHRCRSPYYREIPDEFVQYLQQERNRTDDWPFLAELAHFEWMELQLSITEAEPVEIKPLTHTQLLSRVPVFAPVMQLLHYQWPVHSFTSSIKPLEVPETDTYILGFRDNDDRVQFIHLNPTTARLITMLGSGLSGQQALEVIGSDLDGNTFKQFMQFGLDTLAELHRRGAIIDSRPAGPKGAIS
jgi:hypothetical protein